MSDSFFPSNSPWGQSAQQIHQPGYVGVDPTAPADKPGANQRDLEEAHHLLRGIINNLDQDHAIPVSGARILMADLNEIETLLYRNLR